MINHYNTLMMINTYADDPPPLLLLGMWMINT